MTNGLAVLSVLGAVFSYVLLCGNTSVFVVSWIREQIQLKTKLTKKKNFSFTNVIIGVGRDKVA